MDIPIETLTYFVLSFLCTALLSVAARSLEGLNLVRAKKFVEEGGSSFAHFLKNPQAYIVTVEILHAVALTALVVFAYLSLMAFNLYNVAIVSILGLSLLFSHSSLKHLFDAFDELQITRTSIKFLKPFVTILRPISFPIEKLYSLFQKGEKISEYADSERIEEELELMIDESQKQGGLEKFKGKIMRSAIDFGETIVREIMVPRTELVACSIDSSLDEAFRICAQEGYSRLPVYEGSLDEIVGLLYFKDIMLKLFDWNQNPPTPEERESFELKNLIREAYFVPETNHINELFNDFQRNHIHMAIVIDEFGGTAGVVTLEDLMEEFFGEIQDEYDSEDNSIISLEDSERVLVDAKTKIYDINELFEVSISEDEDFDTVGGLVSYLLGKVGSEGDAVSIEGLDITVRQANERCILQVEIGRVEDATQSSASE